MSTRTYSLVPSVSASGKNIRIDLDEYFMKRLVKEWAAEVKGWYGASGGWIYRRVKNKADEDVELVVCQGWWLVYRMHNREILDWLTSRLTGCTTLYEMVAETAPSYRPTIRYGKPREWRYRILADAYDALQVYRGDPRRAYRGGSPTLPSLAHVIHPWRLA